ncbi:type 1 fimbrial protein [Providencia alcalifaciens]|uniref:fimbrial protein n=1 Tax=Providencia alcalifaciens TaxID=126385 RepID=UPI001CE0AC2A|nr:fimbrial protein [Providencia alcalifaciens]UBX50610.1 type 1 fimbrial protein [Providencia alcalifaciens]
MKSNWMFSIFVGPRLLSFYCVAGDSITLNFNGNIKAAPCPIEQTNYVIDLKTTNIANLRNGQQAPWINFSIKLKDCPTNTRESVRRLTGTAAPTNSDYFINSGTAKNVALDLVTGTRLSRVKNGTQITTPINLQTRQAEIPFSTRITSLNNVMVAGTFRRHVEFVMAYN